MAWSDRRIHNVRTHDISYLLPGWQDFFIRLSYKLFGRTGLRACTTGSLFCFYATIILNKVCLADLCQFFSFKNKGWRHRSDKFLYRLCNIRTEALMIIHYRLHHSWIPYWSNEGSSTTVWTGCNAKGACCTILIEISYWNSPGWTDRVCFVFFNRWNFSLVRSLFILSFYQFW